MGLLLILVILFMIGKTIYSFSKEEYKKIHNYLAIALIVEIIIAIMLIKPFLK